MSTATLSEGVTAYLEAIESLPENGRLLLSNVSWEDYEVLLEELSEKRHLKISYDGGNLEIMTLSPEHEAFKGLFTHLIQILTEEMNLPYKSPGSTTMTRRKRSRGTEPDDCFYIENVARVRRLRRIDLSADPPPDLAVEIEVTHPSLDKMPIYAALEIPEFWRFDGKQIHFYRLVNGQYLEIQNSDHFPFLTPEVVLTHLEIGDSEDINEMRRAFREWVRASNP
jgi:Uma2 family endonuclease